MNVQMNEKRGCGWNKGDISQKPRLHQAVITSNLLLMNVCLINAINLSIVFDKHCLYKF